jgi:hypothetical protein
MAVLSDYTAGTITLTNNSTAFTGTGTAWLAADFREGDVLFQVAGQTQWTGVIASITSNTAGTLVRPWGGATGTYQYRMRYMADGARVTAQARNLIELLGNGNLQAVAGLPGTPQTLMMFTGPGTVVEVPRTDLLSGAVTAVTAGDGIAVDSTDPAEPVVSLRPIVGFQYDTLADLEADTVPAGVSSVRIVERVAGNGGGAFWSRQASEPDVPALAKTQDARGAWWMLNPENGIVTPEMFGARGGLIIESQTRTIFNAIVSAGHVVRERHLRIIDGIVRRFKRTASYSGVSYTIGAGGLLTWTNTSLTGVKVDSYNFIVEFYNVFAPSILTEGRVISAAELNAAAAINASQTTTAIHNMVAYCSHGRAKGVLGPVTYVVNQTIRPRFAVTLDGTRGLSRIRMASNVGYNVPLLQTGGVNEPAFDIHLSNFIVDANYDRLSGTAGTPTGGAHRGTAVCINYTNHARLKGMEAYDAFKHCFDVTGSSYGQSGTPGTVGPYPTQISYDVVIEDCWQEGCGDDGFTTHSCRKVLIRGCTSMFTTANYTGVTSNSNGYEADDFSIDVTIENCHAAFCYKAVEVKGHEDAAAAREVNVHKIEAYKCEAGINIQHIGFGNIGGGQSSSASAFNVRVKDFTLRHPIKWINGGVNAAMRILSYANVDVDGFRVIQEGADPEHFGADSGRGGIEIFWEGRNINLRGIEFDGFAASNSAIRITATASGYINIFGLVITNGPLRGIYQTGASSGAKTTLNNYAISATAGTTGVQAPTGQFNLGTQGFIDGYTTPSVIS